MREALRRLGNPYASLQIFDDVAEESELREPTVDERAYFRALGNQYAILSVAIRDDADTAAKTTTTAKRDTGRKGASQDEFVFESRRIFGQYIPAIEKGKLRPHHRAFISRNQRRPALQREYLLAELRKYDLADVRGFQARFNRERDELTADKLLQIEIKVVGSK